MKKYLSLILLVLLAGCSQSANFGAGSKVTQTEKEIELVDSKAIAINERIKKESVDSLVADKEFIEEIRKTNTTITKNNITKKYNSADKEVSISNKTDEVLFKAKLLSSYNMMVEAGEDVRIARLLLVDWDKNDELFDKISAYNSKNSDKLSKTFTFKYAIATKTEEVCIRTDDPKIEEVCTEDVLLDWDKAVSFKNLSDLPKKNIEVGIYTNTILNEEIEWLPTIKGIDVFEWAAYDVTQIDSLEHDTILGYYNSLVKIDSTHFILAYAGSGDDGFIKTFSIDSSYNITQIDSLEHDTLYGYHNSLLMIDSTHFILAYLGDGRDGGNGFIKTFSIDSSYNITQLDSLEHDTLYGGHNSLVMIDSTHFILAYSGGGYDGFIKTFSIDSSYNITQIDSLEHDTIYGWYNSLVKIDSTHFILAYTGNGDDGFIKTFSIDSSYNITQLDSLEHDTLYGGFNSLVMIDSTHFILAYLGDGYDGFIKTFSIDSSYNITQLDSLEHDTINGGFSSLVMIDSTHFILAYTGEDTDGFIKTFSIDSSYDITQLDSLEHDTLYGGFNSLVMIDSTHFILAYTGEATDGFIKTFSIEGGSTPTPTTKEVKRQSEFFW